MRIKFKSRTIKELIPLIIVIIVALLIFPVKGVPVNNTTANWLHAASIPLHRLGPEVISNDILGVPLFPIILASAFKLGGKTVQSASLATRIFFALGIILIYLLGRTFYGIAVGLLSSGLVLTSYGVNLVACFIQTDIVLPFFILLFIFIYYITLTRSSRIWAIFAGISLGLALMVKESALLCLGLPFGMVFLAPKGKRGKYAKLGFWVIGTLVILLVLEAIYVTLAIDYFNSILDLARFLYQKSKVVAEISSFAQWTYLFTTGFPKTIFKYYHSYLQDVTPLSLLMIFGWLFVLIRGFISKKTSDLILAVFGICFLPLILWTTNIVHRFGQTAMIYIFLYIPLATFVVSCISLLIRYAIKFNNKYKKFNIFNSADKKYPGLVCSSLIVLVGFFLIKAQLFDKNDSTWKLWTDHSYSLSIFAKKKFEVYGRYTNEQQAAAEWLKKNAPKNSKIIADGFTNQALDFFDVADYGIPEFHPKIGISIVDLPGKRSDNAQPLYLITYGNFKRGALRHRSIFPIFEEDIVRALKKENPDYLVISQRGLFFSAYFDKAKWACLKLENHRARIYEIHLDRFEPVIFEDIGVNETINEHLILLEKDYPDEYLVFKEKIEAFGLTMDKLKNSQLRFPIEQVY